jgi:hypothetical protein
MNTLSWFIYLIGVVPALKGVMITVAIFSGIALGLVILSHMFNRSDTYSEQEKENFDEISAPVYRYWRKVFVWILCVSVPITVFVPNQKTMILIGASEFGEKMLMSEKAQKLLDPSYQLLEAWINEELKKLKEENTKK